MATTACYIHILCHLNTRPGDERRGHKTRCLDVVSVRAEFWLNWVIISQEGQWWSAALDDLTSTITQSKLSWDGLGWAGQQSEEKQPGAVWELLQDCWKSIPGDDQLAERMPTACKADKVKGGYFGKYKIQHILFCLHFFVYPLIPCVNCFDVSSINIQCRKVKN